MRFASLRGKPKSARRVFQICAFGAYILMMPALRPAPAVGMPQRISFASLNAKTQITVYYESQGCFHHFRRRILFGGTSDRPYTVTEAVSDEVLGKGHLSAKQAAQLDNLLAFYRVNKHVGCTTFNTIKVSLLRNGKSVQQEYFKDNSGYPELYHFLHEEEKRTGKSFTDLDKRVSATEAKLLRNLTTIKALMGAAEKPAKTAKAKP